MQQPQFTYQESQTLLSLRDIFNKQCPLVPDSHKPWVRKGFSSWVSQNPQKSFPQTKSRQSQRQLKYFKKKILLVVILLYCHSNATNDHQLSGLNKKFIIFTILQVRSLQSLAVLNISVGRAVVLSGGFGKNLQSLQR